VRTQAGLNEVVAATLARVSEAQRQAMMRSGILLTGGCTELPGFARRVEQDVRMNRPTRCVLVPPRVRGLPLCAAAGLSCPYKAKAKKDCVEPIKRFKTFNGQFE
jgi:actin-related protein